MSLRWTLALASRLMKAIGSPVVTKSGGSLAPDDYFELFVLARALRLAGKKAVVANLDASGYYVVTASPSASWAGVSYLDLGTSIVRSGVEVRCVDGENAEIDLGVLVPSAVQAAIQNRGAVDSSDVRAAVECKDHGRRASRAVAHEVLGKTHRLRRRAGTAAHAQPGNAPDVALATRSGVTPSAAAVLRAEKIDCLDAGTRAVAAQTVDDWLRTRI
jgi:hypothetical protein